MSRLIAYDSNGNMIDPNEDIETVVTEVSSDDSQENDTTSNVVTIGSLMNKSENDETTITSTEGITTIKMEDSATGDTVADINAYKATTETAAEETKKETYVADTGILDSGNRTEFASGAVRDIQNDKGDEYLIPFKEVSEMIDYYLDYKNEDNKEDIKVFQESVFDCLNSYKTTGDIKDLNNITDLIASYVYNADTPMAIMEVAIHFKNGATKYSPRNWEKGMPVSNYISSFIRHFLKYIRGDQDEHHERAMLWNALCAIWTIRNHPELDDFNLNKSTTNESSTD